MSADRACTAAFTLLTYALTLTKTGPGTVTADPPGIACGATCTASYTYHTLVTLTATPTPDAVGLFQSADGTFYLDYVVGGPGTHPPGWVRCSRAPATPDPFRTAAPKGSY